MELTQQQLSSVIHTQLGKMTIQESINMLGYTPEDFIGFDVSMIVSYITNLKD